MVCWLDVRLVLAEGDLSKNMAQIYSTSIIQILLKFWKYLIVFVWNKFDWFIDISKLYVAINNDELCFPRKFT